MNNKYTFFWRGPFSQWAKSPFTIAKFELITAEQYMMYSKAMLFDDLDIAAAIMNTKDPKKQKALGRKVKNFDPTIWNLNARSVVYEGNYEKFFQNSDLLKELLATKGTTLVEASPYDAIWGIGLDEAAAKRTPPEQWPGKNWLGEVLTFVRDDLSKKLSNKTK